MNQITRPSVLEAFDKLKALSADEEAQRMAFVRERALMDELSELAAAETKGRIKGRTEGRAEGRTEGRIEGRAAMLERLLQRRFGAVGEHAHQRLREATPEQLDAWAERLLDARTLDDIFVEH